MPVTRNLLQLQTDKISFHEIPSCCAPLIELKEQLLFCKSSSHFCNFEPPPTEKRTSSPSPSFFIDPSVGIALEPDSLALATFSTSYFFCSFAYSSVCLAAPGTDFISPGVEPMAEAPASDESSPVNCKRPYVTAKTTTARNKITISRVFGLENKAKIFFFLLSAIIYSF